MLEQPKTTTFITSQLNRSLIISQCLKLKIILDNEMTSTKFIYYVQINKSFFLKTNSFLILLISTSLKIVNSPPKSVSNMEEEVE